MEVIKDIELLKEKLTRLGNNTVGLIYAKGALHEGHRKLIQTARRENFLVVLVDVALPREFQSSEAYALYPKCTKEDEALASLAGVDFFFAPEANIIDNGENMVGIKLNTNLAGQMNGQDCPNYYENKLLTIAKVLNIVKPSRLYISDKDIFHAFFVEKLLNQFQYQCKLRVVPAVRDENQMLLSAKNAYLKDDERKQVSELYNVLLKAKRAYARGMMSSRKLKWHIENEMSKFYLCRVIFLEVIETDRFQKIETIIDDAIIVIGIKVGQLRLYDHIWLSKEDKNEEESLQ